MKLCALTYKLSTRFPVNARTIAAYTGCIKKKVIELQRATLRELLGV